LVPWLLRPSNGYSAYSPAHREEVIVVYTKTPTFVQSLLGEPAKTRYMEIFLTSDEVLTPLHTRTESHFIKDNMTVLRKRNPYAAGPALDAFLEAPLDFLRTGLKFWVHQGEPADRIAAIITGWRVKMGAPLIDMSQGAISYPPVSDPETRADLLDETNRLQTREQLAMFIARTTNTGPSEWTKPFGHDLCICWDTKNQFTLREFLATGDWRYPPNPFPAGLEEFLAQHEPFRSMSKPGTTFSLTGAFGGKLALEVFMQMVFKSGWAVRKVQDRIDDLAARTDQIGRASWRERV
jgi:hypothetical protein